MLDEQLEAKCLKDGRRCLREQLDGRLLGSSARLQRLRERLDACGETVGASL